MGYEEDVVIDKNNLDEECVLDAGIYDAWSRAEVEARKVYDKAKDQLKLVEFEVELELRGMTAEAIEQKYNVQSVKEATYTALVHTDRRVRRVKEQLLASKAILDATEVARRSLEKRGSRIDNLVYLHGQGYFGRVKGTNAKNEAVANLKKKYSEAIEEVGLGYTDAEPDPAVPRPPDPTGSAPERERPITKPKTKKKKED